MSAVKKCTNVVGFMVRHSSLLDTIMVRLTTLRSECTLPGLKDLGSMTGLVYTL